MADQDQNPGQDQDQDQVQAQPAADNPNNLDPTFFSCVNEFLELTNRQSREHGLKRISLASMFASARFNSHVYLTSVEPGQAGVQRKDFMEYMTTMYRRMLNEHLDGLGHERNIDVGESELAADYAAAGVQVGNMAAANGAASHTPANDYVSAAGAVPPPAPANE